MAEPTQFVFNHKEVVTALIKQQNLHAGIWMLTVNFGLGAANISQTEGGSDLIPAAILTIPQFGIQLTEQMSALAVDASEVNPL